MRPPCNWCPSWSEWFIKTHWWPLWACEAHAELWTARLNTEGVPFIKEPVDD